MKEIKSVGRCKPIQTTILTSSESIKQFCKLQSSPPTQTQKDNLKGKVQHYGESWKNV